MYVSMCVVCSHMCNMYVGTIRPKRAVDFWELELLGIDAGTELRCWGVKFWRLRNPRSSKWAGSLTSGVFFLLNQDSPFHLKGVKCLQLQHGVWHCQLLLLCLEIITTWNKTFPEHTPLDTRHTRCVHQDGCQSIAGLMALTMWIPCGNQRMTQSPDRLNRVTQDFITFFRTAHALQRMACSFLEFPMSHFYTAVEFG